MDSLIVGTDGKPLSLDKYATCPQCGCGPQARVPSGGFGDTWFVCQCGFEFNKELKCPKVIL